MNLKHLATLVLILTISFSQASANDDFWSKIFKRKQKKAKEQTELVADSIAIAAAQKVENEPIPEIEEPLNLEQAADTVPDYMITVNYTPAQMDSLITEWNNQQSKNNFADFFTDYINIDGEVPKTKGDSLIYTERLKDLASPVELAYNDIVHNYIARYTDTRYATMSRILSLSQFYFPNIEQELIKYDLPVELRAMAIIESALTSTAISRAGAAGLWQFMPTTGKYYGLEVNSLIDERCDPVLATDAACRFMRDLYNMFGDWTLAIAAYNCGPGNVNKAIARAGIKSDSCSFWDIYDYLPRETRGYVPAFIGASYAYAYHDQYGIESEQTPLPLACDTIHVDRILHLGQVAEVLELPIKVIRELNPQYRKDIIPATTKSYALRLPQNYITQYIENQDSIFAKDSVYLKEYLNPANIDKARKTPSGSIHVVKSGDTLGGIARRYGVSVRSIMSWNNLRSANRISIGQRLVIQSR